MGAQTLCSRKWHVIWLPGRNHLKLNAEMLANGRPRPGRRLCGCASINSQIERVDSRFAR